MNISFHFFLLSICVCIANSYCSTLDVPFVPTPYEVVNAMLDIASVGSQDTLYDLGCGDGRIVITAVSKRGVKKAVGVDMDPQRIEECKKNATDAGVIKQTSFIQDDLFNIDFHQATVLTLYLLPEVNLKLRPKIFRTLKAGTRVVSHDFNMGSWEPDQQIMAGNSTIYLWIVPANVSGSWSWNMPETPNNKITAIFNQQFQKISAKAYLDNNELPVSGLLLHGSFFSFSLNNPVSSTGESIITTFFGVVSDNQITGKAQNQNSGSLPWTARRDPSTIQNIAPAENIFRN